MKNAKKMTCLYLYADGHAVTIWEQDHKVVGKVEWAEIHQHYGPEVRFQRGRVTVGRYDGGMQILIKNAWWIDASEASRSNGSDATKKLGIEVGYLKVGLGNEWHNYVMFNELSCLSGEYTYQPDMSERFEDVAEKPTWGCNTMVVKVHRVSPKPTPVKDFVESVVLATNCA